MSDNRPSVYYEGDRIIYRASSLGLPLRSLVAARLGYEPQGPPSIVREAGDEGTSMEPVIRRNLGEPVEDDRLEVEFEHGLIVVRGHIDGRVPDGSLPERLLEIKGVSVPGMVTWRAKRWGARPGWAWQTSGYCCALLLDLLEMAVFARGTDDVDRWVAKPLYGPDDIRQRLDTIEHWAGLGMLPPAEPGYQGWDGWAYLHRLESVRDDSLGSALRDYLATLDEERAVAARKAAVAARKAEQKQGIIFLMGDRQKVCAEGLEATHARNGSLTVATT